MVHVQRFFSIALGVISIVVLIEALPDLDLGASLGGDYDLWGTLSAMAIILGIVIAGHVAYVIAAADYPRYLPSDTPAKDIVRTVMWSAGGSGLLLGVVGILLASQTDADLVVDTFGGVKSLMPSWLYLPFLLAAIGGSLTNLMLTMYSAGLAAQAAGLPIKRYHAVIVDAVLATIGLVYVLFYDEALLTTINDIVVNTIIWVGPWGVIWIYDAWRRNWNIDPVAAHGGPGEPVLGLGRGLLARRDRADRGDGGRVGDDQRATIRGPDLRAPPELHGPVLAGGAPGGTGRIHPARPGAAAQRRAEVAGVAVITGAASGLGAATARRLRQEGLAVAGFDLHAAADVDLAFEVDVRDADAIEDAVARTEEQLGPVEYLMTAAGVYELFPLGGIGPDQWRRMLAIHIDGTANACRSVYRPDEGAWHRFDRHDRQRARSDG